MRLSISLRRYVAIAALVTLSVLLLRPVCEALASHPTPSHAAPTALMHHDSQASAAAVAGTAKDLALDAPPISAVLAVLALAFVSAVATPRIAASPPRSYYARSARILR